MTKKILVSGVMTVLLSAPAVFAEDSAVGAKTGFLKSNWEIGVIGNFNSVGDDSLSNNGGIGIRGAYRFADYWRVTADASYNPSVSQDNSSEDTDYIRLMVDINYDFFPENRHTPYLLAGLGYAMLPDTPDDRDGLLTNLGLGYKFLAGESIGIEVEACWISNLTSDPSPDDNMFQLIAGVSYRF